MRWFHEMRRFHYLMISVLALGIGIVGYLYYARYVLPIQAVEPLVQLFERGTSESAWEASLRMIGEVPYRDSTGYKSFKKDPSPIMMKGAGSERVKRALLRAIENARDNQTLRTYFLCVISADEQRNPDIQDEKDWAIIRAATVRYNAYTNPPPDEEWYVTNNIRGDGRYTLGASGPPIP